MTDPLITVLAYAKVPSPSPEVEQGKSDVVSMTLRDALTKVWPTDAHLTAYEPVNVRVLDADGNETDDTIPVRLTRSAIGEGIAPRMVAMIGDVDPPEHVATPEWRAEVEPRLEASGLAWYSTRNGYRVVATIADPIVISSEADELQWYEIVLGWREHLIQAHGIEIDPKCKDWTRIMRLPNVQRDGQPARSDVRHLDTMPVWDFTQWIAPPGAAAPRATPRTDTPDDARTARARRIAERMPASIEGLGGDEALFQCACEVATQLGEDAAAIEGVLSDKFNPRCDPPWPPAKLRREAERAASRQATPEARHMRRADERRAELEARPRIDGNADPHVADDLGRVVDWSAPITPVRYLCEGLGIGWVGKCVGIHGYAGASKGIMLARLCLSASTGAPFLGFDVARVPVVYCDAETGALAENRIKRLALAMGVDLGDLAREGWWEFRHVSVPLAALIDSGAIRGCADRINRGQGVVFAGDSYSSMVAGDENSSEYADPLWQLGQLGQVIGAIPIVTMHERKGKEQKGGAAANLLEGISGTNRLAAALASSIRLTPSADNDRVITVGCTRAPERRFEPIQLEWRDTPDGGIEAVAEALQRPTDAERRSVAQTVKRREHTVTVGRHADVIEGHLSRAPFGMRSRALREVTHLSGNAWREAWAECQRRGTCEEISTPDRNAVTCRLRQSDTDGPGPLPIIGSVAR